MVSYLHNLIDNFIYQVLGPMPKTFVDILHAAMTNQFFILAVAIALFLLAVTLSEPGHSGAELGCLWC